MTVVDLIMTLGHYDSSDPITREEHHSSCQAGGQHRDITTLSGQKTTERRDGSWPVESDPAHGDSTLPFTH